MSDKVVRMSAYDWLTSDHPAAQEWQSEAAGKPAWGAVYDLAASQSPRMRTIPLPQTPIERPPVTAPRTYFNIPAAKQPQSGRYFNLPKKQPAPATKFFVIPKGE